MHNEGSLRKLFAHAKLYPMSSFIEPLVFERLFDAAHEIMCVVGTDGSIRLANQAFVRLLGWSRHELSHLSYFALIHEEDTKKLFEYMRHLSEGQPVEHVHIRVRSKANGYKELHISIIPSGRADELYVVGRSATNGHSIQTPNLGHLQQTHVPIEHMMPHVGRWEINMQSGQVNWSDTMFDLFGYQKDAYVPRRETALERIEPEARARLIQAMQKAIGTFAPPMTPVVHDELLVVELPDGTKKHLQSALVVVGDEVGKPTAMHGYMIESHHPDSKSRPTESHHDGSGAFRMALEQVRGHAIIADKDAVITYVNPAAEEATGYARSELLKTRLGDVWAVEGPDREYYQRMLMEVKSTREKQVGIVRCRHKNGQEYMSEVTIVGVFDESGKTLLHFVECERTIR